MGILHEAQKELRLVLTAEESARLWARVIEVGDPPNACWIWTGPVNGCGHGRLNFRGKHWYIHRLFWCMLEGPIPEGMVLDHKTKTEGCGNKRCCRPSHLSVVTGEVNSARTALTPRRPISLRFCCEECGEFGTRTWVRNHYCLEGS